MKGLRLAVLLCAAAAQLAIPARMILQHERTLELGAPLKFRIQLYDPYDPMQGRYVALRFSDTTFSPGAPPCPVADRGAGYVLLEPDAEGFARPVGVSTTAPETGIYVRADFWSMETFPDEASGEPVACEVTVNYPFERYYVEESKAPRIEAALRAAVWEGETPSVPAWVVVRIHEGDAVLEELFIGGTPASEYIEKVEVESGDVSGEADVGSNL